MNPRRVQAPQLQTPNVATAGDVTVTVTVTATVTVTVSFSFYCITASVMLISVTGNAALSLWFLRSPYPVSFVVVASCAESSARK